MGWKMTALKGLITGGAATAAGLYAKQKISEKAAADSNLRYQVAGVDLAPAAVGGVVGAGAALLLFRGKGKKGAAGGDDKK